MGKTWKDRKVKYAKGVYKKKKSARRKRRQKQRQDREEIKETT